MSAVEGRPADNDTTPNELRQMASHADQAYDAPLLRAAADALERLMQERDEARDKAALQAKVYELAALVQAHRPIEHAVPPTSDNLIARLRHNGGALAIESANWIKAQASEMNAACDWNEVLRGQLDEVQAHRNGAEQLATALRAAGAERDEAQLARTVAERELKDSEAIAKHHLRLLAADRDHWKARAERAEEERDEALRKLGRFEALTNIDDLERIAARSQEVPDVGT